MKNIHLLPTDKPSRLVKFFTNKYHLCKEILPIQDEERYVNIYITSDEEIKKGDWIYGLFNGGVILRSEFNIPKHTQYYLEFGLKIILTTDQDLIADSVQAIDNDFLEFIVKNPSCEWVEVKKEETNPDYKSNWENRFTYKILIPQEEPKQETLDCPFDFTSRCTMGSCDCKPKQETPEKAAERILEENYAYKDDSGDRVYYDTQVKECIVNGAKWQQERMYSEEEVLEILLKHQSDYRSAVRNTSPLNWSFDINKWFEKSKKK